MSAENLGGAGPRTASALARRMKAIREPAMRRVSIAQYLARTDPRSAVDVLSQLIERAHRAESFVVVLDALGAALAHEDLVGYETRRALYIAAKDRGHDDVARLLFSTSIAPDALGDSGNRGRPLAAGGRPLTLGERKSLARGHRREALTLLLRDPDPSVTSILLGNPHITERDVLVIASRRPSAPRALEIVFASERWITRYAVKRALVLNPYTPIAIATRLVTTLHEGDLRDVAGDGNLHDGVRDQARAVLARRSADTPNPSLRRRRRPS